LTYWIAFIACFSILIIGTFILHYFLVIVIGVIGTLVSFKNLYKHLKLKKYHMYDSDNFYDRMERIHGGK